VFNKIYIVLGYVGRLVVLNTYVEEVTILRVAFLPHLFRDAW